jgi:hypothetical protein
MTIKNVWTAVLMLPVMLRFAFSSARIGAHLAAPSSPSSPAPAAAVYIAALGSLMTIGAAVAIGRRSREWTLEAQVLQAAQRELTRNSTTPHPDRSGYGEMSLPEMPAPVPRRLSPRGWAAGLDRHDVQRAVTAAGWDGIVFVHSLSTMKRVAGPLAAPITCNPYRPPVASSALSMVVSMRAQDAPAAWPSAMAPPRGLSMSG